MNSMGLAECRRRCPGLIIKPMRVDRYREAGQAVLSVLETFGAPVEKTSYDDFYIEATSLVQADSDASKLAEGKSHVLGTTLPIDLRRGYELAERMRVALRASVGLSASVGIGRSKLVARMLSPQAKPDGALVVREDDVPRLMASCRVQSFPGLQAKRGHAMCAALTTALEAAAPDASSAPSWAVSRAPSWAVSRAPSWAPGQVTLGQALALPEAALRRALSGADVSLLRQLARGEDAHHNAAVTPRGLPKVLASSPSRADCA
ncbi:DNA polymerase iv [Chrysochromulina tobinii]|uniref:DNA polymerase iv n=1 Tax=Chrysochromulina tobinii TaxID=1460289 RepID=A0A0M0JW49_9EUKA|nr:DNA polymerase iv [Chrysochromulina tobinii]|eukprot:KOO30906.1 DNA polymerase iv [Chrysochromulina sp. CCMP291]